MESERRKPELSQWFTPPDLALRIVEWALEIDSDSVYVASTYRVLEPSAGRGALAIPLRERVRNVVCVDLDPQNCEWLRRNHFDVYEEDFLELEPHPGYAFELVVMNPPFEGGQTERHIMHALKFAPRVVCHCPLTTLAGQARGENLWSKVHLHRLGICSSRPSYGGKGGMTDMCTVDVTLRTSSTPVTLETEVSWWP
jgi:methylase of polypeptide subunit release factors